ncbi:Nn.00g008500.m01.CDS01 [Neocucurbitaria sp. VM-36]
MDSSFDYIVVGGGTAGVVIASRLKQYLPDSRIALVEAGPNAVDHPKVNDVSDPVAWIQLLQEGLVVDYSTTPQEHLDNRAISNPAGRLLSGSSGVNVGNWMRASAADHEVLAKRAGHERFMFKNMVKYFKRLETHFDTGADKEHYGFDGPIYTIGNRRYPLREILQQSAENLGHRYNPNTSKGDQTGLAEFVLCFRATSESTATRQHSAKVYDLSGVDVFCDTPVARILLDKTERATGIELLSGKKLYARKEVIVSCGAQKTPQLLMLSGIGPSDELAKHSISTVVDFPAIGQNLFDHSIFLQYYKLKDPSKGYSFPYVGKVRPEYSQGLPVDFSLFANIPATELAPYLQGDSSLDTTPKDGQHSMLIEKRCHYMNMTFYLPMFAHPLLYPTIKEDGSHIGLAALNMLPLSRGTVTLKSADPKDNPVCNPRFFSTATDRYIMRRAVRENLILAETEPLASEIETEVAPADPKFPVLTSQSSDEDIDARIRAYTATIAHPMGTCALGTVLDDEFKVKGVSGLRVCDASVFPEPIAAMPSCTIYALAEICAELVAGRS